MQWTHEQQAIIDAQPGQTLVSAAAGSGKTAVMTERIVDRIVRGACDIQQILVVTFTDAAARSMRQKIEDRLKAALDDEENPDRRRLISRQLGLLPSAAISTIHAFCLQLIRDFYYLLRDGDGQLLIEPDFSVDDGLEANLLLQQTLEEWINRQYLAIDQAESQSAEQADSQAVNRYDVSRSADLAGQLNVNQPVLSGLTGPADATGSHPPADEEDFAERVAAFFRLMDGYGDRKGDQPVRDLILAQYRYLRSLPDYGSFIADRLGQLSDSARSFSASSHARTLFWQLRLRLERAVAAVPELQDLLLKGVRFAADTRRQAFFDSQFRQVLTCLIAIDRYLADGEPDWDTVRTLAEPLSGLDMPRQTRNDSPEKTGFMTVFIQSVAEVVHFLSGQCRTEKYTRHFLFAPAWPFNKSSHEIQSDITAMLPSVRLFFDLVLGLDLQYAAAKRAAGLIDFSDFEHFALAILRQDEARNYCRQHFREVYIDEYQDTSSIQEAIMLHVSQGNCHMVGDVKQSIYRFRHARPQIFRDKAAAYANGQRGSLYLLNRNFRSAAGILAAVNDIFAQIMSEGAGEITYDATQALVAHRPDDPQIPDPVQLLLLDRSRPERVQNAEDQDSDDHDPAGTIGDDPESGPDREDLSRTGQEALLLIREMRHLHDNGLAWRDMAVLARTRAMTHACRKQLESAGLPVAASQSQDNREAPVLQVMYALIDLIDNSRQDIPLAAVLRSGLSGDAFSLDDLVKIRLGCPDSRSTAFHEAVLAYASAGSDQELADKTRRFLDWLMDLRVREQSMTVGELIGYVYAGSDWFDRMVSEQPGGAVNLTLLRQFRHWAEDYERKRQRGVSRFARYLEEIRRNEDAAVPFASEAIQEDAVQIMTIHGSKGLEFPVVFLIGIANRMPDRSSRDALLISENLGIGFDFADPDQRVRYATHLKLAMQEEIRAAALAEEMRLLYVAMTRAMDRLYLIGSIACEPGFGQTRSGQLAERAALWQERLLPAELVLSAASYLEWILMTLVRNPAIDLSRLGLSTAQTGKSSDLQIAEERTRPGQGWQVQYVSLDDVWQTVGQAQEASDPDTSAHTAKDTSAGKAPDSLAETAPEMSGDAASDMFSDTAPEMTVEPVLSLQEETGLPDDLLRRLVLDPYQHEQAARLPVKLSVSELKQRQEVEPDRSAASLIQNQPRGIDLSLHGWPDLRSVPEANRSARTGTALHLVFRFLDLEAACRNPVSAEIARQLDLMVTEGMLTDEEADLVRVHQDSIAAFAASPLAARMAAAERHSPGSLQREIPLTLLLPACEVYTDCSGLDPADQVMVQGIIDCWFRDEQGITLVDYKSDRIGPDLPVIHDVLHQRYARQLDYYARAIEAALGEPVPQRLIWHVRSATCVSINA